MELEEFINRIEFQIYLENNSFRKELLLMLKEKYKKILKSIEILVLDISKNEHSIELKCGDEFYFELDFEKKGIKIIIGHCEEFLPFDQSGFQENYKKIISSLFDGSYKIVRCRYFMNLYYLDEIGNIETDIVGKVKCRILDGVKLIE